MPIQLPNLDDRTYDDLVQEGLSLIPSHAPEWTNHNPADPGITLLELFAYTTEMLLYRLNRVTDTNQAMFLRLLNGPDWQRSPNQTLDDEIRDTVLKLRRIERAVTREDFEVLAKAVNTDRPANQQMVSRVHCLPRRNLELPRPASLQAPQPGHISVIIVPDKAPTEASPLFPTAELRTAVQTYLEPRRLLTDRIHVVAPRYLAIKIQLTVVLRPGAQAVIVAPQIQQALSRFFDPQTWPFGRNIYVSEIYELFDKAAGVDYVIPTPNNNQQDQDEIVITSTPIPPEIKVRSPANNKLSAILLDPDQLVDFQFDSSLITIQPAA